jgi:hypothetical protein
MNSPHPSSAGAPAKARARAAQKPSAKAGEGRTLFLDLDGVFADFDAGVEKLFGKPVDAVDRREMWSRIHRSRGFWAKLAKIPGSDALWEFVAKYDPVFLTGILKSDRTCEPSKIDWVRRHFGTDRIICCMSRDKPKYGKPGDVLVDDRPAMIHAWEAMGGVGVLHRTPEQTIAALKELGFD